MSIEIKVPVLPESIADATMLNWHKQPGDLIRREENLVDIETEKVVLEVPAPQDGVIKEILRDTGTIVVSGEPIAIIESVDEIPQAGSVATADSASHQEPETKQESSPNQDPESPTRTSPAARHIADAQGIDASKIKGSGRRGHVLKEDLLAHTPTSKANPEEHNVLPTHPLSPGNWDDHPDVPARQTRREPMSRLRQTVATRLLQAQQNAALLTTFNEVDLSAITTIRKRHRDDFEKQHGVRLGMISFFVKAAVQGLRRFPIINAAIEGDQIIYPGYEDIGIAVASPRGLVVPVIKNAGAMSFAGIESAIREYGAQAKAGSLSLEDLTGGTFTITNGGVFGSLLSTPIINPPQSAILGMHKIQERPIALDGEVVIRPMMYLALTYDHRIIDGADAVQFLVTLKEALEDPARLMLNL
ncbi:MAG: 2-oxoglutarate dehydrogenase complex dihydrolipoyllysine-residue succinyltransferase [Arenicellales bacterium]|nr:2-oxoglutarate dehydrogenase complex dihydrolipoyllysine-residue succinyltransferase [Arenicellales bacterium]